MKDLLIKIMWHQLASLGMKQNTEYSLESLQQKCGIMPVYRPWLGECIRIFDNNGYVSQRDGMITVGNVPTISEEALWHTWNQEKAQWLSNPDLKAQMVLLDSTVSELPAILSGGKQATEVIFPNSSVSLVENIYKQNPMAAYFNEVLSSRVEQYVKDRIARDSTSKLKILEVGAGTGATSMAVLRKLNPYAWHISEYCYTDISKAFLNHAEETYGPESPFLTYKILNIDKPVSQQDIDLGSFDAVIAANVLHATSNIRRTVRNTKCLLIGGGVLFLNELATNSLFNHLTFGLLEGWWLYNDPELRIPGSPGLSQESWRHVLQGEGFKGVRFPTMDAVDLGQQIIISESDGVMRLITDKAPGSVVTEQERPAPLAVAASDSNANAQRTSKEGRRGADANHIQSTIIDSLAAGLRIDKNKIKLDEPFSSYGLDSIIAVSLARSIGKTLNMDLDITALFEHNTIRTLRDWIVNEPGRLPQLETAAKPAMTEAKTPGSDSIPVSEAVVAPPRDKSRSAGGITNTLVGILSTSLRIEPSRIKLNEALSSYGLDSIIAVNLVRTINQALSIDMDITAIFEHGSVKKLQEFILNNYQVTVPPGDHEASIASVEEKTPDGGENDGVQDSAALPNRSPQRRSSSRPEGIKGDEMTEGFAIVGISGRFPGAENVEEFWRIIKEGRSCITNPPMDRADWRPYAEDGLKEAFSINKKWGAFLSEVHGFDALFFGIAPSEARYMSPEQRLLLMAVWNAIEDSGYTPSRLSKDPTGVFVAVGPSEYQNVEAGKEEPDNIGLLSTPSLSLVPNRISYLLDFQGPSEFCDTTCSSSLVALHRAVQSIRLGECKQAIVGGVNLVLSPASYMGMDSVGMLSTNGRSSPFQTNAEGTVRGEGVGAILIKPLAQARQDNDFIYAVIKGTGVSHGGRGVSLTAPNIHGMKAAMRQAYETAGIDPETVSYIEAHGMGSKLADSAEISALKNGLREISRNPGDYDHPDKDAVYISCLKPCIGHAEVFSGMAALIKAVCAIRDKRIPMIPGFTRLDEDISLDNSSLKIANNVVDWVERYDGQGQEVPRRAGINSYGIGGVNAHVVLQEAPPLSEAPSVGDHAAHPQVIVLSARSEEALRARAEDLLRHLSASPSIDLQSVAFTLQTGREAMDFRLAAITTSVSSLVDTLESYLSCSPAGDATKGFYFGNSNSRSAEIDSLFSGDMGEKLVSLMVAEQRVDAIAQCWVKGANVKWELLYGKTPMTRVPLPGYPFRACHASSPSKYVVGAKPVQDPSTVTQQHSGDLVTRLVCATLGIESDKVDRAVPLEHYGLNSLLLMKLASQLVKLHPDFKREWLQPSATIENLTAHLGNRALAADSDQGFASPPEKFPELVRLNSVKKGRPVFWIHGALGSVEAFQAIAQRCGRPFYAIQARGFLTDEPPIIGIQAMAAYYVDIIRSVQPSGPYDIGGFCLGGIIAYDMTKQLQESGQKVDTCILVDSPDGTGFKNAGGGGDVGFKNAALQVANMLLWPSGEQDLAKISETLIHQDEVDCSKGDDAFLTSLAEIAVGRGIALTQDKVLSFLQQNLAIQTAYQISQHVIHPLPSPDSVDCYYLRNKRGVFYGDFGCHFKVGGDNFSLDGINYWQDWERELSNLTIVDIDAPNHMVILTDERSSRAVSDICRSIYAPEAAKSCA